MKWGLNLGGSFNIGSVESISSSFNYYERESPYYTWPNGYGADPVVTMEPTWQGTFQVYGHDAPTAPVPEPAAPVEAPADPPQDQPVAETPAAAEVSPPAEEPSPVA